MLYLIDLFCGAGGVSTGADQAEGVQVIACVNHDPLAIKSHSANHPFCVHYTEDIRTLNLDGLKLQVEAIRRKDPYAVIGLWASLECTNFSKAKGGLPRDADSRTLAEHLDRYIIALDPDIIYIENVEEFMSWGPLDKNGKPISKDKGKDYVRWVKSIKQQYGYDFDYRILNAADFGAYTSRRRYFAQFAKPGVVIAWPEPTHAKKSLIARSLLHNHLSPWKAVRDVLRLTDHGQSIFGRKKNLSDKTYERIYHGLIKFVAGGKTAFLLKYNSVNGQTGKHVPPGLDAPCPVVSTQGRLGLVNAQFISKYFSGKPEHKNQSIEDPAATVKTKDSQALVDIQFFTTYYKSGENIKDLNCPSPTVTTKDRISMVSADQFIQRDFSNGGFVSDIENPAGAVMPSPKMNLVSAEPFLMDSQYNNGCKDLNNPAPTQTANRKHYYLMNPQYMQPGGSIDNPSFTLIARMDKAPPYIVQTEEGHAAILIEENDTEHMVKIKQFMALYGIADIKMRMLHVDELLRIQGFGKNYVLYGTQADKKKFIGNSVEVNQARVILQTSARANQALKQITA